MNSDRKMRVLVVDDDIVVRVTLTEALRAASYDISAADSVAQAVELIRTTEFDAAIIDMLLTDGRGTQVAEVLCRTRHVPILYLSAYGDHETVNEAVKNGASAYMVKPMAPDRLIPTLESLLARGVEIRKAQETNERLQSALDQGRVISVATGLVMKHYGLPYQEAFETLRAQARTKRVKVQELAQALVSDPQGPEIAALQAGVAAATQGVKAPSGP
jgi:two-component system, response regulator PdtaR